MFCKQCGATLEENLKFCPACGTATEEAPAEVAVAAPVVPPPSPRKNTVTADQIPEEYQPLSPWAYFGLQILFSIKGSNLNRRNFARSYWCSLIIVGAVLLIVLLFALLFTTGKRVF